MSNNSHGTTVLDSDHGLVRHECGRVWLVLTQPGGRLPRRWWSCPDCPPV